MIHGQERHRRSQGQARSLSMTNGLLTPWAKARAKEEETEAQCNATIAWDMTTPVFYAPQPKEQESRVPAQCAATVKGKVMILPLVLAKAEESTCQRAKEKVQVLSLTSLAAKAAKEAGAKAKARARAR